MHVCVCVRHAQKIAKLFFSVRSTQFPFKLNILFKKIYSNLLGPKILRVVLTVHNIRPLVGKLKRRNKDGRGLYLSGAKDGSGLINGTDMYASSNSKRGAELGQGALVNLKNIELQLTVYSLRTASPYQHAEKWGYKQWCTNCFAELADSSASNLVFSTG